MQANDFDEFSKALIGVSDYYRRDHPNEFTIRIWWESLKEFDIHAVQKAFIAHINRADKDGQFMPTVASLRQLIQGSAMDNAALAWSKVTKAVKGVGTYQTVVFDDALIHRVLDDMGGWMQLGQKTEDEWPFVGREFENRYRGYASKGALPDYPPKLIGKFEAQNSFEGYEGDKPVLIGDVERAKSVLSKGSNTPRLAFTSVALLEAA